jgi:hypothetical protein
LDTFYTQVNSAFNEAKVIGFCIYNFAFFVLVLFPMGTVRCLLSAVCCLL